MRRLCLALLVSLPLSACGEERTVPPDIFAIQAPEGRERASFPRAGIALRHPANWTLRRRDAPAVFEIVSGEATIAGWAYPREEPLPEGRAQLERARTRLVSAITERDPEFRLRRAVTTEIAGSPAVEVYGDQVISRRRLRTRSVHVFTGGTEYVIEALAPPDDFSVVDRRALRPMLRTIELDGVDPEAQNG